MENFTIIFLVFLSLYLLVALFLNHSQKQSVIKNKNKVPEQFSEKITLESHQKAANYTLAKLQFANIELIFSLVVLIGFTLGGGIEFINNFWNNFSFVNENPLFLGASIIISIMIIGSILDLPFGVYRTFILEEKFGFNKTDNKTFIIDIVKNFIVSLVIGLPILMLILYLVNFGGELWWLFVWLSLSGFSLLMFWAYPSFIAPIFNKFKPLEDSELSSKINDLLAKTGFSSNGLFVMDGSKRSSHGNAYFSGFGKNKRIVFFDTLLKGLTDNEVLAVLAHELGHFKKKHILKHILTSFTTMFIMLFILGFLIDKPWFFTSLGVDTIATHNALILFIFIVPIFTFFLTPISNIFSRKHEFEADEFATKNTNGKDLISALVSMYKDNASTLTPSKLFSDFYDSHPPASIRIKHIEKHIKH
jgi:STE24 endopeptidase